MKKVLPKLVLICLLVLITVTGYASTTLVGVRDSTKATPKSLFKADDVFDLKLKTNMPELLKDRGNVTASHSATIVYTGGKRKPFELPVKVSVRGNFRRDAHNCKFPPLLLDFAKKQVKKTPFERHDRLKLVTHCLSDEYVVREYLVYKMYNVLTDYSFRARLIRVTYEDATGKRAPDTKYAFFLEDETALARRNVATAVKLKQFNMASVDSLQMAMVAIFEYMIGNTDWSVPYLHNIRLLASKKRAMPRPVPYDFDHAGIVEATYAKPAEQLEISSVRERLYRGQRYPEAILNKVFKKFKKHKASLYALYQNNPALDKSYVKRTLKYLDQFYELIDKPKQVKIVFLDKSKNKDNVVIKGLK